MDKRLVKRETKWSQDTGAPVFIKQEYNSSLLRCKSQNPTFIKNHIKDFKRRCLVVKRSREKTGEIMFLAGSLLLRLRGSECPQPLATGVNQDFSPSHDMLYPCRRGLFSVTFTYLILSLELMFILLLKVLSDPSNLDFMPSFNKWKERRQFFGKRKKQPCALL